MCCVVIVANQGSNFKQGAYRQKFSVLLQKSGYPEQPQNFSFVRELVRFGGRVSFSRFGNRLVEIRDSCHENSSAGQACVYDSESGECLLQWRVDVRAK